MNFRAAISDFHDFLIDVDELQAISNHTEHEVDALHKRCQSLINTFYGDNKWVNTFAKDIEVLIVNKDNDDFETRFHRLRLLVENIRHDLYLKQRIDDEEKEKREDVKQQAIDKYSAQIINLKSDIEYHKSKLERLNKLLTSPGSMPYAEQSL